jgi:signal transduction histidine kinase
MKKLNSGNIKKPEILIVEDSLTQAEQLRSLLEKNNFKVTHASNGKHALTILEKLIPDLVISDIIMPEMDGYQLCIGIKENIKLKHIPVILLTYLTDPEDVLNGLTCGADNFFTKPYQEEYLLAQIRQILLQPKLNAGENIRIMVEIYFAGKRRLITANQMQMLTLLLSTYEAAVIQNRELLKVQEELKNLNDNLEDKVEKRTAELKDDIAARMLVEHELIRAKEKAEESDKLKSAFLSNMSHEIRTPLNGILGFTGLLNDKSLSDSERDEFIKIVDRCSQELLHTVSNILDISKIEAGQDKLNVESINIIEFIENILWLFQPIAAGRKLSISLKNYLPVNITRIITDPDKLRRALNNLIDNAIKFTETGGVEIVLSGNKDHLFFEIRDTGIGIDPQFHKIIFDRFRQVEMSDTRTYGGNGLGLSIAKSLAEIMGGTIAIDSFLGIGSAFTLSTPLIQGASSETVQVETKPQNAPTENVSGKTILIAEDEFANSLVIKSMLKSTGLKILLAVNGLEAIELCKNEPAISLVLMDIKMPEMDGLTATRIIKSLRRDLPIIATTAYAFSNNRDMCLEAGCSDYLPKPFKKEELLNLAKKYLS